MKNEVLLFTSGLDSYIARDYLNHEGHDVDCLYFDHGGRYCRPEMEKFKDLDFEVIVSNNLHLGEIEEADAHIPNRNLLMTIMAQALGYKKVWLGGSLSDRVGDNKSEVYQRLSELLSTVNEEYSRIDSPFYHCYKDDMVKWFVSHRPAHRIDLLTKTFSCFNPKVEATEHPMSIQGMNGKYKTKECLNCSACFRKSAVLYSGDIYAPFYNPVIVEKYEEQFRNPVQANPRTEGTMAYIDKLYDMSS